MRKILLVSLLVGIAISVGLAASKGIIGIDSFAQSNPYFIALNNEGAIPVLEAAGYQVVIIDANQSPLAQSNAIYTFIGMHVKAILVTPIDAKALTPAIEAAVKAGIPVYCADEPAFGAPISGVVETDNYLAGYNDGKYAITLLENLQKKGEQPPFEIGIGTFNVDDACVQRVLGFEDAIKTAPAGLIKVVAIHDDGANFTGGYSLASSWINAFPKMKLMLLCNDPSSIGGASAISQLAPGRELYVLGIDGNPDAVKLIASGTSPLIATASQYPTFEGWQAAENLLALLDGKPYMNFIQTTSVIITKDNVFYPWAITPSASIASQLTAVATNISYPIDVTPHF